MEQKLAIIGDEETSGSSVASTDRDGTRSAAASFIHGVGNCLILNLDKTRRQSGSSKQTGICAVRKSRRQCETPALPPALTVTSSPSSRGACERSDDRCGVIEIEFGSGVRVRVHEGIEGALLTLVLGARVGRSMIALPKHGRVYLACGSTDMRRGFDGLAVPVLRKS